MTTSSQSNRKFRRLATVLPLCVFAALLFWLAAVRLDSQNTAPAPEKKAVTDATAATKPANTDAAVPAAKPESPPMGFS